LQVCQESMNDWVISKDKMDNGSGEMLTPRDALKVILSITVRSDMVAESNTRCQFLLEDVKFVQE